MDQSRILSYNQSHKVAEADLDNISASGMSNTWCANATYGRGAYDGGVDVTMDC
jgi:hypothetical protein